GERGRVALGERPLGPTLRDVPGKGVPGGVPYGCPSQGGRYSRLLGGISGTRASPCRHPFRDNGYLLGPTLLPGCERFGLVRLAAVSSGGQGTARTRNSPLVH